jgi:hypothetical protein
MARALFLFLVFLIFIFIEDAKRQGHVPWTSSQYGQKRVCTGLGLLAGY